MKKLFLMAMAVAAISFTSCCNKTEKAEDCGCECENCECDPCECGQCKCDPCECDPCECGKKACAEEQACEKKCEKACEKECDKACEQAEQACEEAAEATEKTVKETLKDAANDVADAAKDIDTDERGGENFITVPFAPDTDGHASGNKGRVQTIEHTGENSDADTLPEVRSFLGFVLLFSQALSINSHF